MSGCCPTILSDRENHSHSRKKLEMLPLPQRNKHTHKGVKKIYTISIYIEESLEAKLPTIWTHEKQRWEE